MNVFISGGCKNGKSYYAQHIAKEMAEELKVPLYYIATMIPRDEEDNVRIARHIDERAGWGFITIEQPAKILEVCQREEVDLGGVFLLDSVTAITENEMFPRVKSEETGEILVEIDESAGQRVKEDMVNFAKATGNTIFVSDGIYGDGGEYSESTEEYRQALAGIDIALAGACDRVIEISYGQEEVWK